MPRRLFAKLHSRYAGEEEKKNRDQILAQKSVLTNLGVDARRHDGTHGIFQAFYGGHAVASTEIKRKRFALREKAQRPYVVIVGAGLAGLSCAYELLRSGQYNVIVIEAKNRVGGRVWSVKQENFEEHISSPKHEHLTVERGGELIGLNHFFWLNYADALDLHLDYLDDPSEAGETTTEKFYEYTKLITIEMDDEAAKLNLYGSDGSDQAPKPWELPSAKELDAVSLETYLEGLKAKYKHITLEKLKENDFPYDEFDFDYFCQAVDATKHDFENNNGTACDQQSLLFNLITIANGNRNLDRKLFENVTDNIQGLAENEKARKLSFWTDAELFRCREGNMALALRFQEKILEMGGQILVNHPVSEITIKEKGNVRITYKKDGADVPIKVPGFKVTKVVIATAPSAWKHFKISPPIPAHVTPTMGYLVKYLFNVHPQATAAFRECDDLNHSGWGMVWEAAKNTVSDAATSVVNTLAVFAGGRFAHALANPPRDEHTKTVEEARRKYIFSNMNKMRPEGLAHEFKDQDIIQDVFMDWPKDPQVEGGYSCPSVNECVSLGPLIHSPFHQKIYLAGEYACRYKWCGFMEGALISGAGVAKDILRSDHLQE